MVGERHKQEMERVSFTKSVEAISYSFHFEEILRKNVEESLINLRELKYNRHTFAVKLIAFINQPADRPGYQPVSQPVNQPVN